MVAVPYQTRENCCGVGRDHEGKPLLKEGFQNIPNDTARYVPDINAKYWPTYYYSFPYQYRNSGAFPEDMYTRLRFWSPGFYTGTGWKYQLRPGMGFKYWPRNRWVRKTYDGSNKYYYISQRGDYTHDPKFLRSHGVKI